MNYEKKVKQKLLKNYDPEFLPPWYAPTIILSEKNTFIESYVTSTNAAFLHTPKNEFLFFQSPEVLKETIGYLHRILKKLY